MPQFEGHEVVKGECIPVMVDPISDSAHAMVRSSLPGAAVEWREAKGGTWHSQEDCPALEGNEAVKTPARILERVVERPGEGEKVETIIIPR